MKTLCLDLAHIHIFCTIMEGGITGGGVFGLRNSVERTEKGYEFPKKDRNFQTHLGILKGIGMIGCGFRAGSAGAHYRKN